MCKHGVVKLKLIIFAICRNQNPLSYLGSIAITPRGSATPYTIPLDNPFIGQAAFLPEVS